MWIVGIWLAFVGGAIGSFMNVVIYRMPAGLSVVHPGSRCSRCEHPIRWYDNLPVLSWFLLGGKCRDCGASFTIRYAAVEVVVAALFLTLAGVELFTAGANLPQRAIGIVDAGWSQNAARFWPVYAYHLMLICSLICVAMIQFDGHRLPGALLWAPVLCGWIAPLACPAMYPVPLLTIDASTMGMLVRFATLVDSGTGMATGAAIGWIARTWVAGTLAGCQPQRTPALQPSLWAGALCGLYLGWQAALIVGGVATLLHLVLLTLFRQRNAAQRWPWSALLTGLTVIYILAWKPILEIFP